MGAFRVRMAAMKDTDVLVRQRHMMSEVVYPRTAEEHRVGDRTYGDWTVEKMKKGHLYCYLATDKKCEVAGGDLEEGEECLREARMGAGLGNEH